MACSLSSALMRREYSLLQEETGTGTIGCGVA